MGKGNRKGRGSGMPQDEGQLLALKQFIAASMQKPSAELGTEPNLLHLS
jgi:hypothetical protein